MKLSYSSTKDFQACKARYFHKHIAKDAERESSPALDYGNRVHKAFEDYLKNGISFPADICHYQVFADATAFPLDRLVEHRLAVRADGTACGFYDEDRFWNCKIDLTLMNDITCLILDWKTGNEREDPFELAVQAVLLSAHFPGLEIFKGRYVWLKNSKVGALHNLTDVKRTWAEMQAIGAQINRHTKQNYWPEEENPLCGWCPVRQCRFNKNGRT